MASHHVLSASLAAAFIVTGLSAVPPALAAERSPGNPEQSGQRGAGAGPSRDMHRAMMKDMQHMQGMRLSGDMDHDFATMMRQHHQQGINMAEQELRYGKDPKMKALAQKILDGQNKEVAELDDWLKSNKPGTGSQQK